VLPTYTGAMDSQASAGTRGSAFSGEQVEAGFWCVLGSARGVTVLPHIDDGVPPDLLALLEPALSGYGLDAAEQERVAALVVATRLWARDAGSAGTISAAEFERARRDLLTGWGAGAWKGALVWPPTSRTVAVRLGGGHWNDALESLGVATSARGRGRGGTRFTSTAQVGSVARFLHEAEASGGSTSFAGYTDWARRQRVAGHQVPAPATVRQHFGSWSAAVAAAREGREEQWEQG
jgi:hypothetical protein